MRRIVTMHSKHGEVQMQSLQGRVAVVAGATRGAGRGIATALGEAGAIVYCSGRSTRTAGATPGRPETIEETAEIVTRAGGAGIAQRTDHTVEAEVEALFARVRAEQGRLDILVNDVWGGDELTEFGKPFWELTTTKGFTMLDRAVRAHILTSRHGVPLMIERNSGLVVEITDGDKIGYRGNLFYDLAKTTAIRLAYAMAHDLDDRPITALAVTPGFLRSEAMLDRFGVAEANWHDAIAQDSFFAESETPLYVGRAVASLAADPNVHAKRGKAWASWTLKREYGFTDRDGRQPDWGAFFARVIRELVERGAPYTEFERFLLRARALDIEFEHSLAEEHAQLSSLLAAEAA
jgi:NAD(P)-dependent dehydrogenase (short-subunit alcohol dehydrogenase family)